MLDDLINQYIEMFGEEPDTNNFYLLLIASLNTI